jgi:hypothetical protein
MLTTLALAVRAGSAGDGRVRPRWALVGIRRAALSRAGRAAMGEPESTPMFAPGELEELLGLVHLLFEALPSHAAEMALRACMRSCWPHLNTRDHLLHVLAIALEQSRWRR